ncbi:MAG: helix-turn-helix domain-containing protein [Hyphomicrobiaceae bacterium]
MPRTFDARRVKLNHSYTIWEAADLLGAHRNTVHAWLKAGLPYMQDKRPWLILGRDLRAFLDRRKKANRVRCPPDHLYCLRCRTPRLPAGMMLDYTPVTAKFGNLKGLCSVCHAWTNRKVSLAKVEAVAGRCQIMFPQGQERITASAQPSLNSDKPTEDRR